MRLPSNGIRLLPRSVSDYSTLGGISAYSFLEISPSASRFFRVSVSTLGDMSGIALPISLKRVASFSASTHSTSMVHLPEKRLMTFLTGHDAMPVYFFKFSFSGNAFIFKNSYQNVSALRLSNVLHDSKKRLNFALSKRKRLTVAKLIV